MHCPSHFLHLFQPSSLPPIYFPSHLISPLLGPSPPPSLLSLSLLLISVHLLAGTSLPSDKTSHLTQMEVSGALAAIRLTSRQEKERGMSVCGGLLWSSKVNEILVLRDGVMRWTGVLRQTPDRIKYQLKSLLVQIHQLWGVRRQKL